MENECQLLEKQLCSLCTPAIYIDAGSWVRADGRKFMGLIQRILNQLSPQLQEKLIDDGVYGQLRGATKEADFFGAFQRFIEINSQVDGNADGLARFKQEHWVKSGFETAKMKLIRRFADILQKKVTQIRAQRVQKVGDSTLQHTDTARSEQPSQRAGVRADAEYKRNLKIYRERCPEELTSKEKFELELEERLGAIDPVQRLQEENGDTVLATIKIFQILQRIEHKVDALSARVDSVEGMVKGLYEGKLASSKQNLM